MAKVKSKNTKPELIVRRLIFSMGYRYRLHVKRLPGTPDLVFIGKRKVIFINGCFWHQHPGCKSAHIPESRMEYWVKKLNRNAKRDKQNLEAPLELGWKYLVILECEIKDIEQLKVKISQFLCGFKEI